MATFIKVKIYIKVDNERVRKEKIDEGYKRYYIRRPFYISLTNQIKVITDKFDQRKYIFLLICL